MMMVMMMDVQYRIESHSELDHCNKDLRLFQLRAIEGTISWLRSCFSSFFNGLARLNLVGLVMLIIFGPWWFVRAIYRGLGHLWSLLCDIYCILSHPSIAIAAQGLGMMAAIMRRRAAC
jgi:hypothetical protein